MQPAIGAGRKAENRWRHARLSCDSRRHRSNARRCNASRPGRPCRMPSAELVARAALRRCRASAMACRRCGHGEPGLASLLRIVTEQFLSLKAGAADLAPAGSAARALRSRTASVPPACEADLRGFGLSGGQGAQLPGLAQAVVLGRASTSRPEPLDDDDVPQAPACPFPASGPGRRDLSALGAEPAAMSGRRRISPCRWPPRTCSASPGRPSPAGHARAGGGLAALAGGGRAAAVGATTAGCEEMPQADPCDHGGPSQGVTPDIV